ncbi:MAG: response regulator, partial [Terriglobia bacterium]
GILTCIRTGSERPSQRMVLRPREGAELLVEETIAPLPRGGAVSGAVAIFRDLSESLKLEQAQKFETIGVLAGGVAHDFNNLLAVMIGNASLALQLLEEGRRERRFLDQVIKSGAKAAELTAQLLAYAGKNALRKTPVDLAKAVYEMVELIGPTIPYRIDIPINIPEDLPPIEGDASQIQQIVMNLVINASEAIGEQTGVIEISAGTLPHDGWNGNPVKVFLQVRDTGSGMDAETRLKVFDPFFSTKFTGRGLGLAAVAGIVHSHDGTISVESTPGIGSIFRVVLPAGSEAARATAERLDPTRLQGTETILVVDDLETIRTFVGNALENCGYTVLAAENGKAALELLAERREIDLVLLDLSMPVMTGAQAAPRIRKLYPEVAICIMTGYNETLAGVQFPDEELGSRFLQKPFSAKTLSVKIRTILDEPERRARAAAGKTDRM